MKDLLYIANNKYNLIIVDSLPVLAVANTQVFSNSIDRPVLVISSRNTQKDSAKKDSAKKAKELLESAETKILGVVLNNKKEQEDLCSHYG